MTYAEHSIRICIQRYCAFNGQSKEIPLHVISQISKYQKFRSDFRAIVGDEPTDQEYCYHLNIKPAKLKELRTYMIEHNTISLSGPVPGASGDGDRTMEEILSDNTDEDSAFEDAMLDRVAYQEGKELLWEAVSDLGGNQSIIIENEFQRGYTLEMNAQQLEISKERVRQIKAKAMRLLRSSKKAKAAAECYDYGCDQTYHWGVGRFKHSGTSSTEFIAMKRIEAQQERERLAGQGEELSSSIRVIGYRFGEQGKVPIGVRKLEEINAEVDQMLQEWNMV